VGDAGCAEGVWSMDSTIRARVRTRLDKHSIVDDSKILTGYTSLANELDQRHTLRSVEGFSGVHDSC